MGIKMKRKKEFVNNTGKIKINNKQLIALAVIILVMMVATIISLIYVRSQTDGTKINTQVYKEYKRHYAFITDSLEDNFWSEVYDGAIQFGKNQNVCLEWMGKNLVTDYSKAELLEIAIASKVDGIILEGDGSKKTRNLVNEAVNAGIPVVTVLTDCYESNRQSFVGIGSYNMGREYGRQIVRIATKDMKKVLILMDTAAEDIGQNIVFNGINETLINEANHLQLELKTLGVRSDVAFSEEEAIRNIFLYEEELPDIIICMNEKNTMSAYQSMIDYNLVGQVNILGYYVTDTILNAISRDLIAATIAIDTKQMGMYSVNALNEFIETGHVSDYIAMDVNTVTKNNVEEYLRNAGKED